MMLMIHVFSILLDPDHVVPFAVMIFISGILLLYSAVIVPVQICMWDYNDPCNIFPTLYFDICVDSFFLVRKTAL